MEPIQSIADLPFRERDAFELLRVLEPSAYEADEIEADGLDYDDDYYQFGYARVERVTLVENGATEPLPDVRHALLLALHSADDPEELFDDVELEFFVEEVHDDYSVTVLLSDFLHRWLPRISGSERAIVLVLCNPHHAVLAAPVVANGVPVYYAMGDVISRRGSDGPHPFLQLYADDWRRAE